jgi:hypothetical protein
MRGPFAASGSGNWLPDSLGDVGGKQMRDRTTTYRFVAHRCLSPNARTARHRHSSSCAQYTWIDRIVGLSTLLLVYDLWPWCSSLAALPSTL